MADVGSEFCPSCKIVVIDTDKAICCEFFCQKWFHCACVKVSDKEYEYMKLLGEKSKWACQTCDLRLDNVIKKADDVDGFKQLSSEVSNLIEIVKYVASDNKAINDKVDLLLKSRESVNPNQKKSIRKPKSKCNQLTEESCSEILLSQTFKPSSSQSPSALISNGEDSTESILGSIPEPKDAGSTVPVINSDKSYAQAVLETNTGDKWMKASGRRSKPSKSKPIIGSNTGKSGLKIAEKSRLVFISRCAAYTEVGDIEAYLKDDDIVCLSCEKLQTRYSDYSSFKVSVSANHFDEILTSDFWPAGIFVKEFFEQPRQARHRPFNNRVYSGTFLGKKQA